MTLISTQDKYPNYPAFHNLVKRRWNTERKEMKLLSLVEAHRGYDLAPFLNQYEWNPVILSKVHPYTALKNILFGQITAIQMATLFQFKNANNQAKGDLETVNLFIEGRVSQIAKSMIQSTLYMNKEKSFMHLNDAELNFFFNLMRQKPVSEQRFFVIPNRAPPEDRKGAPASLSDALYELGFEVFSNMPNKKWMVPSFGMMEAFGAVYARHGEIKIEPVIGFSSLRQIVNGMKLRIRDFAFELEDKTIEFDGLEGRSIEGPAHDFHHYLHHLLLPSGFLEAFGEIASFLLDESEGAEETTKAWMIQLIQGIADIESFEFRKDDPGTLNFLPNRSSIFWFLLGRIFDENSQELPSSFKTPNFKLLIAHLFSKRNEWIKTFNIDVNDIPATQECLRKNEIDSPTLSLLADLILSCM